MLAHWHHINKAALPFQQALDPNGLEEVSVRAQLSKEQRAFVHRSAVAIQQKGKSLKVGYVY